MSEYCKQKIEQIYKDFVAGGFESKIIQEKILRCEALYFDESFETNLENNFAKKVIAGRIRDIEKYLLYKKFLTLIADEINLAKISKNDKALFIGSGSLPMTAILLNRIVGCSVDCYEQRKQSVNLSRRVILEFGLSKKIKVFHCKGHDLDDGSYAVIIIACLAKPKDKILKRVWSIVSLNTRIICRISDGINSTPPIASSKLQRGEQAAGYSGKGKIKQIFYEPSLLRRSGYEGRDERYILEAYTPINKVYAKSNQTFSSALLIKS